MICCHHLDTPGSKQKSTPCAFTGTPTANNGSQKGPTKTGGYMHGLGRGAVMAFTAFMVNRFACLGHFLHPQLTTHFGTFIETLGHFVTSLVHTTATSAGPQLCSITAL